MRLIGTIVTPAGAAYELLGGRDLLPDELPALFGGSASGKAIFFDAGFRLRPVGSGGIFAPPMTAEQKAEFEDVLRKVPRGKVVVLPTDSTPTVAPAAVGEETVTVFHDNRPPWWETALADAPAVVGEASRG
jgi:hypothetical protein